MPLSERDLEKHLHKAGALPLKAQRLAMEGLTSEELWRADDLASGWRIAAGHGEMPSGGSDHCATCGLLERSNKRVAFAFHPTVLLQ